MQLLHNRPATARALKLWLDVGEQDQVVRPRDEGLHQQLAGDGLPHIWHMWPGDHNVSYWSAHLDQYLHFYDAALR